MKYLILAIASLFVAASVNAAPPRGGHSGSHHSGGHSGHHPSGPSHNYGRYYGGRQYNHWCFSRGWNGYTHVRYHPSWGYYLYWSPTYSIWYRYDNGIFIPVE